MVLDSLKKLSGNSCDLGLIDKVIRSDAGRPGLITYSVRNSWGFGLIGKVIRSDARSPAGLIIIWLEISVVLDLLEKLSDLTPGARPDLLLSG